MPEITLASVGNTHVEAVYLGTKLILDDWTPRSLFAVAGTLGGWYDFTDRSTLYQNATCTVPITAGGQKVAGVKCKIGKGVNIINTVVANQPTYVSAGKGNIAFGGTSFLYGFDDNLPNYANFTLGYSSKSNLAASKTNTGNIFATGDEGGWATALSVNGVNGFETQGSGIRYATYVVFSRRDTVVKALGTDLYQRPANTWDSVIFDTGVDGTGLWKDSLDVRFKTSTGGANNFSNFAPNQAATANNIFRIGHSVGLEYKYTSLDGNISCVVILNRRLTPDEKIKLTTYLNKTRLTSVFDPPVTPPVVKPPDEGETTYADYTGLGLPNEFNKTIATSDTLVAGIKQLRDNGWQIVRSTTSGSFSDKGLKIISFDANTLNSNARTFNTLAHEVGHAVYTGEHRTTSREAFIADYLKDEGYATMYHIKVVREAQSVLGYDIGRSDIRIFYDDYDLYGFTEQGYSKIGTYYGANYRTSVSGELYKDYYGNLYDRNHAQTN